MGDLLREAAFIGGAWAEADNGATITVHDPASGEPVGTVPQMGAAETARAIAAAEAALPAWRALTAGERGRILRRWFELILASREELARLLTSEQGKPLAEARAEIDYAAAFIDWFAEEGKRVYGDVIPANLPDRRLLVLRQPVGVVAAITPWNFPAAMVTRKVAPALAAGCTLVLKPASKTPFTALALAALATKAGVPAGVFSVVTGSPSAVAGEMCANPVVRKLSFTGSTEIGKALMVQCAPTMKKLSLELGGNAPFIVFDDADVDAAVDGAMASKFRNTGQTCVCANRLLVQDGIHDRFVERLAERVSAMTVAPGVTEGSQQGPLIDANALAKVEAHVADALAHGATVVTGGARHALGGNFYQPTVLTGIDAQMLVSREETFGPIAPITRFSTEAEAIALANDTPFGLASYFYTRDVGRIFRVGEALETGMVGANTGIISTEVAPFGGIKESGVGREGSKYGIEDYLELKYLCIAGL
ncbi:NAD-dependent succinate-semialdehyde dehydrogenase [Sphingomonas sp. AOB5]|uniref:NAD-dependent succinate-semialdehyde dehydrogenase n=1 Tax=Sphingomonas sp. AOB5 TaxID=3034017 RepID=UPI0023F632DA|nr:NAD-dependent succinate-semialdehyde dehydrogenase [Sphingomonas sp. AOB5]MDF7775623.1 NAD-dependent succinate-semialdehyde dehydrogenase [Sphingomonas sp. AOB5]